MNKADSILVTGARGLVGTAVVALLRREGFQKIVCVGREECDLTNSMAVRETFERLRPKYVFHAAARVYGIMGNLKNKALSFYDNVMINTNVVDAAWRVGVEKVTVMGTGAVYPFPSPGLPLQEHMIFMGEPHPAEDSYAHSKRAMLAMLQAYEESHDLKWAYIISCNLFGPHDKFDPKFGHVVPALIYKFFQAKISGSTVEIWGDGSAQRDFMYVEDAAKAALAVMRAGRGPINMGTGSVLRIREIVEMLTEITGMHGRVEWDASKPNGQDYRAYDLSRLKSLGFAPDFSIEEGLRKTWDWFCRQHQTSQLATI